MKYSYIDLNLVSYLGFFDGPKYDKWDKNKAIFYEKYEKFICLTFFIIRLATIKTYSPDIIKS